MKWSIASFALSVLALLLAVASLARSPAGTTEERDPGVPAGSSRAAGGSARDGTTDGSESAGLRALEGRVRALELARAAPLDEEELGAALDRREEERRRMEQERAEERRRQREQESEAAAEAEFASEPGEPGSASRLESAIGSGLSLGRLEGECRRRVTALDAFEIACRRRWCRARVEVRGEEGVRTCLESALPPNREGVLFDGYRLHWADEDGRQVATIYLERAAPAP